jgi:transaldolase
MAENEKLAELSNAGVAVWLDDLSRDRIRSGNLQSLVDNYSVVGVTTNPTIFAAAISGSASYDDQVHAMAVRKVSVEEALRTITAADVRDACDLLTPVAQRTGRDGRVSLEVSPGVAHDTDATAAEAAHLWWLVDRPNLFIKIPATQEGLAAITTSIAEGISVNVTLIFSPERYRAVMDAYVSGLEQRVRNGGSLSGIESVASFFVSRVDTEIDKRLDKAGADPSLRARPRWRTRSWPTRPTRKTSPPTGGVRWRRMAPSRNAPCGPRPASRTPTTRTPSTSAASSRRTR